MIRQYLPAIPAFIFCLGLTACNSNPGWNGPKSEDKAIKLAEEACSCINEVMESDPDFSMSNILDGIDDYRKHVASGGSGSTEEKWPDIAKALGKMDAITDMIDGSPCMAEVDDKALSQGVSIEAMFDALDKHCSLAIFYN